MNDWQTDIGNNVCIIRTKCLHDSDNHFELCFESFAIKILMLQSRSLFSFFCENTHLNVLAAFETNVEYPDKAKGYANVFCCMFFWMEIRIQLVLLCHKSGRERESERKTSTWNTIRAVKKNNRKNIWTENGVTELSMLKMFAYFCSAAHPSFDVCLLSFYAIFQVYHNHIKVKK